MARGVLELHVQSSPATQYDVECCHAALGVLYTLLSRHSDHLMATREEDALLVIIDACFMCLHQPAVSREATVTAAVAMVALLSTDLQCDADVAAVLCEAVFPGTQQQDDLSRSRSVVDSRALEARGTSIQRELLRCTPFARICLLKGLLTAAPGASLAVALHRDSSGLLIDAILPELCTCAETATCAHERYHAVSGCASAAVKLLSLKDKGNTVALSEHVHHRLESIAWAGWEDPQPQVVRAVQTLFDALYDLRALSGISEDDVRNAALRAALKLLHSGPRKGRWAPLASMVRRVRAHALLSVHPTLVDDVLAACEEDAVCAAATGFLRVFAEDLLTSWTSALGASQARDRLHACLSQPLLRAMLSAEGRLRSNVGSFVLSPLLTAFPELAAHLLRALVERYTDATDSCNHLDGIAAAVITLLRPARALGLSGYQGADSLLVHPGGEIACTAPEALLLHCVQHADSAVRLDAMEMLCSCPRLTELPSLVEARLLRAALRIAMCGGPAPVRNRIGALLRRILPRISAGLARTTAAHKQKAAGGRSCNVPAALPADTAERAVEARSLVAMMLRGALQGVYPGAPFERKYTSLDTLAAVFETWAPAQAAAALASGGDPWPYDACVLAPGWAHALLAGGVDSWDRIREKAAAVLTQHVAPLPGLGEPADVTALLHWIAALCRSPRVRESDSAAQLLQMLVVQYVGQLRWTLRLPTAIPSVSSAMVELPAQSEQLPSAAAARVEFIDGLVAVIEADVSSAELDRNAASRTCFVHGPLLALRTCLPALHLGDPALAHEPHVEERAVIALQRLLEALRRLTTQVVLATVARPEAIGAGAADVAHHTGGIGVGTYLGGDTSDEDEDCEDHNGMGAPKAQVLMTAAWLASKEVALLIGALAWRVPSRVLSPQLLVQAGAQLVDTLLVTKHNGVVDKARQGLVQLSARLLQLGQDHGDCADAPRMWVDALLDRLEDPSQGVRDLIRRSAGLPFALLSLCCAEPTGITRALLPRVLRRCLAAATHGVALPVEDTRYVPAVHALHVLRVVLADHDLAPDTAGALQPALTCSLDGFSSPHWAVRNAAGLLFASLCARVTGVLNPGTALRRGVTAADFFQRFSGIQTVLATHVRPHAPALLPALALLARLQPAENEIASDGSALVELVREAAGAAHATTRAMSARALVPLVPPSAAIAFATGILDQLPDSPHLASYNSMHGDLEHSCTLLKSCTQPANQPLVTQLMRLRWMADPAICAAPPVRCLFLALLSLAIRRAPNEQHTMLLDAMETAAAAAESYPASSMPGDALWRKQAALCRVEVSLVHGNASPLLVLLGSPHYEVRGALLKGLQVAHQEHRIGTLPSGALAATLCQVAKAHHWPHKVATRSLELLLVLPPEVCTLDWQETCAILEAARDVRHRAAALRLHARVMALHSSSDNAQAQLIAHMDNASQASSPDELRQASADALRLSGMLMPGCGLNGLRAWVLSIRLLEDEEHGVRGATGEAITAAGASGGTRGQQALGQAVSFMCSLYATEPELHLWLLDHCAGDPLSAPVAGETSHVLSRRLFIHEKDNQHAEELHIAQLCAQQLRRLAATHGVLSAAFIGSACCRLRANADGLATILTASVTTSTWLVGGLSFHEDVFMPLVRCLMTVWALSPTLHSKRASSDSLIASVRALCLAIDAHRVVHPLLRAVTEATVREIDGESLLDDEAAVLFLVLA